MAAEIGHPFEGFSRMTEDEIGLGLRLLQGWRKPARLGVLWRLIRTLEPGTMRDQALHLIRDRVPGGEEWAATRLASPDRGTAVSAAYALALWGDKRGAATLREELAAPAPAMGRGELLEALVTLGEPAGIDGVIAGIREAIRNGKDPEERSFQLLESAPIGDPRVEEVMGEILDTAWPAGRGDAACDRAVRTLRKSGGPRAASRLAGWWKKDPSARPHALAAAAALADPPALASLARDAQEALGGTDAAPDALGTLAALQRLAGLAEERRATLGRLEAHEALPENHDAIAEVALGLWETGQRTGAELYLGRFLSARPGDAGFVSFLQWDLSREAGVPLEPSHVRNSYNNESWEIVTHPERLVHPALAVRLSEHTVAREDDDAPRGTLGVAYFRAGRWEDCVKTLERNVELGYHGKEQDLAALVMSYLRLGRTEDAAALYERCKAWEVDSGEENPLRPEMDRAMRDVAPPRTPEERR